MSETTETTGGSAHARNAEDPEPYPRGWSASRVVTWGTAALAVVAVAVAVAAWFRAGHGAPSYDENQTSQAKTSVCGAYDIVHQGVLKTTNKPNPNANDPVGALAVAANARVSLLGGGLYLRERVAAEPAAPGDLAKALNNLSTTLEQLGVNYLAETDNTAQTQLLQSLNGQFTQIDGLCK
jgi:hypothetical protein